MKYKGADPANELTTLVALIRRVCGIDASITPVAEIVRRNFTALEFGGLAGLAAHRELSKPRPRRSR